MNPTQTERLAAAIAALRPDWPLASVRTFLETRLTDRAWQDAAVALTWVATDPATTTPARVLEVGPWWRATHSGDENRAYYPPKDATACSVHPGEWRDRCRSCAADALVGDRPIGAGSAVPPTTVWHTARRGLAARAAG